MDRQYVLAILVLVPLCVLLSSGDAVTRLHRIMGFISRSDPRYSAIVGLLLIVGILAALCSGA